MTRETEAGAVICHCSEDDGVPDVGVSVGLGDGKALWIGELLNRDGANMGIVFHGSDSQRIVAPFADGTDWQEIADLFRHHVGPAIAKIADAEAAAMRERAAGPEWQPIATVRSQEEVLVCDSGLLGWWAVAIQNALGEWHYADRHEPLKYVPTHWQSLPSIYPIRALPTTEVGNG